MFANIDIDTRTHARTHAQLGFSPRVPRPVQTDDFSAGKRLHWSENSGAFMEGSEESYSSGSHGPREARPAHAHSYTLYAYISYSSLIL